MSLAILFHFLCAQHVSDINIPIIRSPATILLNYHIGRIVLGSMCVERGLSQPVHETATYRCDDTRGCVMQFWPPDDDHMCSKHVEAWNKLIVKQKFLCIKLFNYWDTYTEMHGQQNVKSGLIIRVSP